MAQSQVKIKVTYRYQPSFEQKQKCTARVYVLIPVEVGKTCSIDPAFISPKTKICNSNLHTSYGFLSTDKKYKYDIFEIYAVSWEELEIKVNEYTEQQLDLLYEVYRSNVELSQKTPETKEHTYQLGEKWVKVD